MERGAKNAAKFCIRIDRNYSSHSILRNRGISRSAGSILVHDTLCQKYSGGIGDSKKVYPQKRCPYDGAYSYNRRSFYVDYHNSRQAGRDLRNELLAAKSALSDLLLDGVDF